MKRQRGLTFMTVLIMLAAAGALFWVFTYGGAYWDNIGVKHIIAQGANLCYQERDDEKVKMFVFNKLKSEFEDNLEYDRDDLRIERTETPPYVHIWFTYNRTVKIPFSGTTRSLQFVDHAEQDLSPVKW